MGDKVYTKEKEIYWEIEPHMLYDYVNFANRLRLLQATDDRYKNYRMDQDAPRWFLLIHTELYQKSLEDLGVMLLALKRRFSADPACPYQKKFGVTETPVTFTLVNYRIGEAAIKKTLDSFENQNIFLKGLGIDSIKDIDIKLVLPDLDIPFFLDELYKNLVAWSVDQEKRFRMYNKIKHGPVVVGSARIFNSANQNAPAVVYVDPETDLKDHPLIVHSLKFTETEFVLLRSGVMKIAHCIRDLLSIYMCKNYPDFLKEKGFSSALLFFKERRPNIKG